MTLCPHTFGMLPVLQFALTATPSYSSIPFHAPALASEPPPQASLKPSSCPSFPRCAGWFDITHLDPASLNEMVVKGKAMDPEGVAESMAHVNALIDAEVRGGVPPSRIVVGGFSQGGHIALKVALTHTPPLAGCAALSTWLEPSKFEVSSQSCGLGLVSASVAAPIAAAGSTSQMHGGSIAASVGAGGW